MSSTEHAKVEVRLDTIGDIARRVGDDIRDLQASTDNWGNEDWSDALSDIGDLYAFAAAQMLYNNQGANQPDRLRQFNQLALDESQANAEAALDNLRHFGFSYTIADLIRPAIDSI